MFIRLSLEISEQINLTHLHFTNIVFISEPKFNEKILRFIVFSVFQRNLFEFYTAIINNILPDTDDPYVI